MYASSPPLARLLALVNLVLTLALPVVWFLPLVRNSAFLVFSYELSIANGMMELLAVDWLLAVVIFLFVIVAPLLKGFIYIALWFLPWRLGRHALALGKHLARYAMADIFLVALSIVIVKGLGVGSIELRYGFYLFAGYVLYSLAFSHVSERLAGKRR